MSNYFISSSSSPPTGMSIKERMKYFEQNQTQDYIEESFQYSGSEDHHHHHNQTDKMMMSPPSGVVTDSQGLIVPKKLINPCLENPDRQNLHRELLFNQKIGKSVLNQKTELQKALEKQKERQFLLQQQHQHQVDTDAGLKGELNRVIMERAQKIEKQNNLNQDEINNQLNPEYLNARAKLRARIDTK